MANQVFQAVITAVDKASAVLDRIAAKSKGMFAAPAANPWATQTQQLSGMERAMSAAAKAGAVLRQKHNPFGGLGRDVGEIGHGVHDLKEQLGGAFEKVAELFPALGALGAGATLTGLFEMTEHVAEAAGHFNHVAIEIGATTLELQQLRYAAQMTDTTFESIDNAMGKLGRAIGAAASGKNKDVAALFAHLKIPLMDAHHHLVRAIDIMPRLQDAMRKTGDVTMRERAAFALFGRAGLDMLPMLMASKEEMTEWNERAKKIDFPFSKMDFNALEKFHHGMIDLKDAAGSVADSIGAKLAPVLSPVIDHMTDWIVANREWIATGFTEKVSKLADWVTKIDFAKAIENTRAWITPLAESVEKWVSLKGVIFGTAAAMAVPWLSAAFNVIKTLAWITSSAFKATFAIGGGLVTALGAAEKAMQAFNLTAMKNPLLRMAMFTLDAWERARQGNPLTQQQLDKDPGEASRLGYNKTPDGKWSFNGHAAPDGGESTKPGWFERNSGWGEKMWHWFTGADDGQNQAAERVNPWASAGNTFGNTDYPPADPYERLNVLLNGNRENRGRVDVNVQFDNAPPGMSIAAFGSGIVGEPQTDVGYAFPGEGGGASILQGALR